MLHNDSPLPRNSTPLHVVGGVLATQPTTLMAGNVLGDRFIATAKQSAFEEPFPVDLHGPLHVAGRNVEGQQGSDPASYRNTLRDRMGLGGNVMAYAETSPLGPMVPTPSRHSSAPASGTTSPLPTHGRSPPASVLRRSHGWPDDAGDNDDDLTGLPVFVANGGCGVDGMPQSAAASPPTASSFFSALRARASSPPAEWESVNGLSTPRKGAQVVDQDLSPPPHSASFQMSTPRRKGLSPPITPKHGSSATGLGLGLHALAPQPQPVNSTTPRSALFRSPVVTQAPSCSPCWGSLGPHSSQLQSALAAAVPLTAVPSSSPFQSPSKLHFGMPPPAAPRHRRKDGTTPSRILNATGISGEPNTQTISWGLPDALLIALGSSVYSWTPQGSVGTFFENHTLVTAVASSHCEDVEATFVAIGLDNGLVHIFSVGPAGMQRGRVLQEHMTRVTTLDIHVTQMASASQDGVLVLSDLRTGVVQHRCSLGCAIYTARFNDDGAHLAIGTASGLRILHATNLQNPTVVASDTPSPVRCVAWNPNSRIGVLVYSVGTSIKVYSLGGGERYRKDAKAEVVALLWSRATPEIVVCYGQTVAAASGNEAENSLNIYDVDAEHTLRSHVVISGHRSPPMHVALSPDGSTVVTGASGSDATLRFWDVFPAVSQRQQCAFGVAGALTDLMIDDTLR